MAWGLSRIWVRMGLWIAATVLVTLGILAGTVQLVSQYQYSQFQDKLPPKVRDELDALQKSGQEDSPAAMAIYGEYWDSDPFAGERLALFVGLLVCLPIGLGAGFWVSRFVTLPVGSIAQAAKRIALGDFTVRAESGKTTGEMAEMVRDFNRMTDALEQLESERKATAAAVSHELRTPLAVLRARLYALCDEVIAPSPAEFRTLLNQTEHLARLVDDLHTLSMAEAGRLSFQSVRLDWAALTQEVLRRHAPGLAQHGITPDLQLQAVTAWIHADPDRMVQVLSNLLDNALRYAGGGAWLELRLHSDAEAGMVELSLSDAGPGLPEEVRKTLFQRFSRAQAPGGWPSAQSGSGLGLSIVYALVVGQGGQIEADTSERGGTRFSIRMPMHAAR